MIKFAPSLLAADYTRIAEEVALARNAGANLLHFDVMDGMFVPNITFGQGIVKAVAALNLLPLDVHLMIEDPDRYIDSFAEAGAKIITVHQEAARHLQRTLTHIREAGCLAGVALNPATTVDTLRYVMGDFDLVLIMTVNPGFGGQELIPQCVKKVGDLKRLMDAEGVSAEIEVDGGVTLETAPSLIEQGANILVAGNAFYKAPSPMAFAEALKRL